MATIIVKDDEIDARYMLTSTLVTTVLLLGLQGYFCLTGDVTTHSPLAYVIPMGVIAVSNIIALFTIRYSMLVTAYGFGLTVEGAIMFMVLSGNVNSLPTIVLVILPVCAYGIAYFVTTRQMIPFTSATVLMLLAFGIAFGSLDNAIPSVVASVVGSILVSRLRTQLYRLRGAIRILAENGRKNKELTQHLRRIAGNHAE